MLLPVLSVWDHQNILAPDVCIWIFTHQEIQPHLLSLCVRGEWRVSLTSIQVSMMRGGHVTQLLLSIHPEVHHPDIQV